MMHYYQRHIGDYAKDTGHLTLLEHGVYSVLLDWCYATEKSLPEDDQAVYRICRASTVIEKKAVAAVLAEFFPAVGGVERQNKRAKNEIEFYKSANLGKRVGVVMKHHPTWTREAAVEWCISNPQVADKRCSTVTTRARVPLTINQQPVLEGGGQNFPESVSDESVISWAKNWPGEMASGTPVMAIAWVQEFLKKLNGRREWPRDWRRFMVSCWRAEFKTFGEAAGRGFGNEKNAPKKSGEISANVKAIQDGARRREINGRLRELEEQLDSLYNAGAPTDAAMEQEQSELQRELAGLGGGE